MSLTNLIVILVQAGILVNMMLMAAAYMVLAERKIAAWIQNRVGPNRVGPWGLFQSFADVFKLYIKEDIVPAAADYKFHALAPVIAIGVALLVAIPLGSLLGASKSFSWSFEPVVNFFRPIPPLSWIPLSILWFGISYVHN